MLLKVGIAMMSAALLIAGAVAVFVFSHREEPVAAVRAAATEPGPRYVEDRGVEPQGPATKAKAEAGAPKQQPEQRLRHKRKVAPASDPRPVKKHAPKPAAPRRSAPEVKTAPGRGPGNWPAPTRKQVRKTKEPRHYQLTSGAVMGLTVKAIGLYNVPVFDSRGRWALDNGVAHVPETSMPWSKGAQRNVYLEGHRLGYPGTGSHLVFYNLDKLGRGDKVMLRSRSGKRYEYRVISTFVVTPQDSWVMGQVRGRDLVTLQTCTGPSWSRRLIVRAERV